MTDNSWSSLPLTSNVIIFRNGVLGHSTNITRDQAIWRYSPKVRNLSSSFETTNRQEKRFSKHFLPSDPFGLGGGSCLVLFEEVMLHSDFWSFQKRTSHRVILGLSAASYADAVRRIFTQCFLCTFYWWEEGRRAASWRKNPFFGILFAAPIGHWLGLQDHLAGILDWIIMPCWIFMLNFLEPVFRRRLPFSLRKNTHGKFAEKFGEKIRQKKCFSLCFLLFSGHPILRTFLNLQIEKIRAESVLQEISLNFLCLFSTTVTQVTLHEKWSYSNDAMTPRWKIHCGNCHIKFLECTDMGTWPPARSVCSSD